MKKFRAVLATVLVAITFSTTSGAVTAPAEAATTSWGITKVTFRGHAAPFVTRLRWANRKYTGVRTTSLTIKCGVNGNRAIHGGWVTWRRVSDGMSLASRKLPAAPCGHTYKERVRRGFPNQHLNVYVRACIGKGCDQIMRHKHRISRDNDDDTANG